MKKKTYQFSGISSMMGQPQGQNLPMYQQPVEQGMFPQQMPQQGMPQVQQMANGGPVRPKSASKKDYKFWERQKRQVERSGGNFEDVAQGKLNPFMDAEVEEGTIDVNRYGVKPGTDGFQSTVASDYVEKVPATMVNNQPQTPNSPFKTVDGELFLAPLKGFQKREIRQDKRKTIKTAKGKGKAPKTTTSMFGDPSSFSLQTK